MIKEVINSDLSVIILYITLVNRNMESRNQDVFSDRSLPKLSFSFLLFTFGYAIEKKFRGQFY